MLTPVLHFLKITHSAEVDTISACWSQHQGPFTFLRQLGLRLMVWLLQNTNLTAYVTPLTKFCVFLHSFQTSKHDFKQKAAENSSQLFYASNLSEGQFPCPRAQCFRFPRSSQEARRAPTPNSQHLHTLFCLLLARTENKNLSAPHGSQHRLENYS